MHHEVALNIMRRQTGRLEEDYINIGKINIFILYILATATTYLMIAIT